MSTQEARAAKTIVRVADAYAGAQDALSGDPNLVISDRQWQACCGVASRFLADPEAMTPALCHHEWRLVQMRSSHPKHWPPAASRDWDELDPMDQYVERAGLAAMRQELERIRAEEEEAYTAFLHPDAQRQHEIDNGWAEH